MTQATRFGCTVLIAALAAACTGTPTQTGGRGGASPKVAAHETPIASAPAGILPSGPAVPVMRAELIGQVRAPASLISNHGGGIISDNGAAVVANNGGAYRLSALDQLPVAGVPVSVLDASGREILGVDGHALTGVTGPDGSYRIPGAPRSGNLVVRATLADGKGELRAIAPRGGQSAVDVEVVSTLTASYILETYVATQADRQATLDRLTPAAEADTRQATGAALDASKTALPAVLSTAAAVETVAELRKEDGALDRQMEVVRKLLVLAGQDDLGNGRPGTEVALGYLKLVAPGPDGSLYLTTYTDGRVWRLQPDGTLVTALRFTKGAAYDADVTGRTADDSGVDDPDFITVDAAGRLILSRGGTVNRLEADGKLKTLALKVGRMQGLLPGEGDSVLAFLGANGDGQLDLADIAQSPPRRLGTLKLPIKGISERKQAPRYAGLGAIGRDASGQILVTLAGALYRFEPASGGLTPLAGAPAGAQIDATGRVFLNDEGVLSSWTATGLTHLADQADGDLAVQAKDNTYLVSTWASKVSLVKDGALVHVAGAQGGTGAGGTAATEFGFEAPNGLAVAPDGTLYISDLGFDRVYRVGADGQAVSIAGSERCEDGDGCGQSYAPTGAADTFALSRIRTVRIGPDAAPWFVSGGRALYRESGPNALTLAYLSPAGTSIDDFVVLPDGGVVASLQGEFEESFGGAAGRTLILHPAGGGAESTLLRTGENPVWGSEDLTLGVGANGAVTVVGQGMIRRWTPGGSLVTLQAKIDPSPPPGQLGEDSGPPGPYTLPGYYSETYSWNEPHVAVDAQGRLALVPYDGSRIDLVDPATGNIKTLVGPGGTIYAAGADLLGQATSPVFTATGDLLFVDMQRRQVRRVPASQVVWP